MDLVGLTGPIKHGKTSFGEILHDVVPGSSYHETSHVIADLITGWRQRMPMFPSPTDLSAINTWITGLENAVDDTLPYDCQPSTLAINEAEYHSDEPRDSKLIEFLFRTLADPELVQRSLTDETKDQFRPLMQWVGNYLIEKVDPYIWFKELLTKAEQDEQAGAPLCAVSALRYPGEETFIRSKFPEAVIAETFRPNAPVPDQNDPTEAQRSKIKIDTFIVNDGDLYDLKDLAVNFYLDLRSGQLERIYQATLIGS